MIVKICGITNREDALAALEGGANAVGFNFYPPSYISPAAAAVIADVLPDEVWKVGVFVDESPAAIDRTAAEVGLQVAQLHGSEQPDQYPAGIPVWKAVRVTGGPIILPPPGAAEAILLDGPVSGQTFDWARVPGNQIGKLILAGGLDASNVRDAIWQLRPWGVDACSRIEISPGRKDHSKMAEFLKAALAASR